MRPEQIVRAIEDVKRATKIGCKGILVYATSLDYEWNAVLSPAGILRYGFTIDSFYKGLEKTTCKKDLTLMLKAGNKSKNPCYYKICGRIRGRDTFELDD